MLKVTTFFAIVMTCQGVDKNAADKAKNAAARAAAAKTAYVYVAMPRVAPGSTMYINSLTGKQPNLPVSTDIFAFRELVKFMNADDQKGIDELHASGRQFHVAVGTAVKVLDYEDGTLGKVPSYEVRILDGRHAGKKGRIWAVWVWNRVTVPSKSIPKSWRRK